MAATFRATFMVTEACNYRCTYCDVRKSLTAAGPKALADAAEFARKNAAGLLSFKFFGGEPTLAWDTVEKFVRDVPELSGRYAIVTNGTTLDGAKCAVLARHFGELRVSVDTEHEFDAERISALMLAHGLGERATYNLVVDPQDVAGAGKRLAGLAALGAQNVNILPVYFTKKWPAESLKAFAEFLKTACALAKAGRVRLVGFQENAGRDASLFNRSVFLDVTARAHYSDLVSTELGASWKKELDLGPAARLALADLDGARIAGLDGVVRAATARLEATCPGQKGLHRMMDYGSTYLNA